jgi:acyl carrier protein
MQHIEDNVRAKVIAILAEEALLHPRDVPAEARLDDIGIDSLALVETIVAIEEAFDIQLPYDADRPAASELDVSTVASVVDAVESLVAAQK